MNLPAADVASSLAQRLRRLSLRQQLVLGGLVGAILLLAGLTAVMAKTDRSTRVRTGSLRPNGRSHPDAVRTVPSARPAPAHRKVRRRRPVAHRKRGPAVAPLTGLAVADPLVLFRPAVVVKVDNLDARGESALPQTGLNQADVVFEEVVEADITRLVAVYQSEDPATVGPVRSARTTDAHLLPQLHTPLLAWAGGNGGVVDAIRRTDLVDVGFVDAPDAYVRDPSRRAPHNLYTHPAGLRRHTRTGQRPPPALFSYRRRPGAPAPARSQSASGVAINWGSGVDSALVTYQWDPAAHGWARSQRGRPDVDTTGTRITPTNVVILITAYRQSEADSRSPEAITVGSGEAFVFTAGRVAHGRWSRPDERSAASLVDDSGRPISLVPGRTWVELPRTGSVTTSR